ncbi:MAG: replication-relaxation family protein [Actinomycetota bacterium]|nr:replication-relaxation family protein [Actinomycetota bacterium]
MPASPPTPPLPRPRAGRTDGRHTVPGARQSERRCAASWGEIVRPDSYGHWREAGTDVDFFLEYDRGTEPLNRLVDKLDGYADLRTATGVTTTWVLFWLPGYGREAALRKLLTSTPVPVATAHANPGSTPADAVWLSGKISHVGRQRLAELASVGA